MLHCRDITAPHVFASWALGLGALEKDAVDSFDRGGCSDVVKLKPPEGFVDASFMCSSTSLPSICPESCGCNSSVAWAPPHTNKNMFFCPRLCNRTQRLCFTSVRSDYTANGSLATGPYVGYACVFPFNYKWKAYTACTFADWPVPWCAVATKGDTIIKWGDCPRDQHCTANTRGGLILP